MGPVPAARVKLAGSWGKLTLGNGPDVVQLKVSSWDAPPAETAPVDDGAEGIWAEAVPNPGPGVRLAGIWGLCTPGGVRAGSPCITGTALGAVLRTAAVATAAGLALTPPMETPNGPLGAVPTAAEGLSVSECEAGKPVAAGVAAVADGVAAMAGGAPAVAAGAVAVAAGAAAAAAGVAAVPGESATGNALVSRLRGADELALMGMDAGCAVTGEACRGLSSPRVSGCLSPAAGAADAWRPADGPPNRAPLDADWSLITGMGIGLIAVLPSATKAG